MERDTIWYIFLDRHHEGPFSLAQIETRVRAGDLRRDVPVWKEGLPGWVSYAKVVEVVKQGSNEKIVPFRDPVEMPPLPDIPSVPDEIEIPISKSETLSEAPIVSDAVDAPMRAMGVIRILGMIAKGLVVLVFLAALGWGLGYYAIKKSSHFPRPDGMSLEDYQRLVQVSAGDIAHGVDVAYAFSPDKAIVWMATNYPLDTETELTVESVEGQILGNKTLRLQGRSYLDRHVAQFQRLQFLVGEKWIPGKYRFKIRGRDDVALRWWQAWYGIPVFVLKDERDVLFGLQNEASFSKAIDEYKNAGLKEKLLLLNELQQKFGTLDAVAAQIQDGIDKALSAKQIAKAISLFEKSYQGEQGAFLTNLTMGNDADLIARFEKFPELAPSIRELSDLARDLAGATALILEKMATPPTPLNKDAVMQRLLEARRKITEKKIWIETQMKSLGPAASPTLSP